MEHDTQYGMCGSLELEARVVVSTVVKEKKYREEKACDDRHDDDYDDDNTIYGTKRTHRQSRCYMGDGLSENYVATLNYIGV